MSEQKKRPSRGTNKKKKLRPQANAKKKQEKVEEYEGAAASVLSAFDKMSATTTASFEAESALPQLQHARKSASVILPEGMYGNAFFNAQPSQELLEKEKARQKFMRSGDDYEARLAVLEQGLCEKYNITPPPRKPNRRKDRGEAGDEILILGQTVNDRRHPKLWGIRQEDRTRHLYCIGGTGSGKLICDYEQVLTEQGWKNIGDIEIGEKVYNRYGKLTTVTNTHKESGKQIWEIEFADGTVIDTYATHPWIIERNSHNGYKEFVKTTEEMLQDGIYDSHTKIEPGTSGRGYRNRVVLCDPIQFPEQDLPIPPYVLGAIIGDGCLISGNRTVKFSTKDTEILEHLIEELGNEYRIKKSCKKESDYGWYIREINELGDDTPAHNLWEEFNKLSLVQRSENKFIPQIYLHSSIHQRRELLQGLMDTDGTAHSGRISYCTISKQLRDDILYLIRSLGYEAHVTEDYRQEKYANSNGYAWNISILSSDVENIFYLQRKKDEVYNYRDKRNVTIQTYEKLSPIIYENETAESDLPVSSFLYGMMLWRACQNAVKLPSISEGEKQALLNDYENIQFNVHTNSTGPHVLLRIDGAPKGNGRPSNALRDMLLNTSWKDDVKCRRVQQCYMRASYEQRMRVIQGFVAQAGHAHGRHIECANKNKKLLEDLQTLITSCGYTTRLAKANRGSTYQLTVLNPDRQLIVNENQMKILERNDAFNQSGKRGYHCCSMAITDIRITNRYSDMTCLTVAEGESYILKNFIVTHNSTLLHAIGVEDMWYHRGGLLIEPHGDLALSLLKTAPPYRIHDIIYLNVLDPIASPGFNPLELPPNATDDDRQEVVGAVTSLIATHFNMDTGYVKLLKMLTNALNAMSYCPGITLLELMDFYTNEDIRNAILSFVPDGTQKDAMRDIAENAKADDLASLDNRISRFTTNRFMRHLFGQSKTTVDFYDLMNQGAYIISPIPKGATRDDVFLKFYGSYIVSEVYKASVMREAIEEGERVNFALTLDECQNFLGAAGGDSAEGILSESRKYGLQMMLANQYLNQLSGTLKAAIMQNCATKLCYALQAQDANEMAKTFGFGVTAADLMAIPKYHVMAAPLIRGGNVQPFISAVFPPISLKSEVSNLTAELIAENSRRRYMKPRDEIEKEIDERRHRLVSGNKEAIIELVTKKNS